MKNCRIQTLLQVLFLIKGSDNKFIVTEKRKITKILNYEENFKSKVPNEMAKSKAENSKMKVLYQMTKFKAQNSKWKVTQMAKSKAQKEIFLLNGKLKSSKQESHHQKR